MLFVSFQYAKILLPHAVLLAVLIAYLCFGAWMLMLLETRTELQSRSKKLVRLTNLVTNFTEESWRILDEAQTHGVGIERADWEQRFR